MDRMFLVGLLLVAVIVTILLCVSCARTQAGHEQDKEDSRISKSAKLSNHQQVTSDTNNFKTDNCHSDVDVIRYKKIGTLCHEWYGL